MKVLALLLPVSRRECPPYSLAMAAALMRRAGHEVAVADMNNGSFHSSFKSRKLWKYTKYGGGVEDGSLERAVFPTPSCS
jgi:phage gp16-like protein